MQDFAWSPDGGQLASAAGNRDNLRITLWDTSTWQEKRTIPLGSPPNGITQWWIHGLSWNPDGHRLAAAAVWPRTWEVATGKEILQPSVRRDPNWRAMAWSAEGHCLGYFFQDRTVWDITAGKGLASLAEDTTSVFFSPDGRRFAISGGASRRAIKLFDAQTGRELFDLRGHSSPIQQLCWGPGSRRLASVSGPVVKVWDVTREQEYIALRGHTQAVRSVAWSPDGKKLASGSPADGIKIWEVAEQRASLTLPRPTNMVAWSPDGKHLASSGDDPAVVVWDTAGRETCRVQKFQEVPGSGKPFQRTGTGVAWSPDGRRLAAALPPQLVLLNPDTGEEVLTLEQQGARIPHQFHACNGLTWSPDGKGIAEKGWGGGTRLWDTATWEQHFLPSRDWHLPADTLTAWSPDARQLASTDSGATITVYNRETRQELFTLRGHAGKVWGLAWSPDGQRLASASKDGTIKLWDLATGQEVFSLRAQANVIAWSPDSWRLASGGDDGVVKIWNGSAGRQVAKPDPLANQARERERTGRKHLSMAEFFTDANRLPEAEEAYRQALGVQDGLILEFPDAPQYRANLAWTHRALGDLLRRMGRPGDALQAYRQALAIGEELAAEDSSDEYLRSVQETHMQLARLYTELHVFGKAAEHYREAVGLGSTGPDSKPRDRRKMLPVPDTKNDVAWFLATCPDRQFRDPDQAVKLAEELIRSGPTRGDYWNTLGVAQYRAGNWKAAVGAMEKSMKLQKSANASIGFFLAMAHWQLGDKDEARQWYDQVVEWMNKNKPQDEELRRFRAEAEELLGSKDDATSQPPPKAKERPPGIPWCPARESDATFA
jgi:WD40 repeat protein